MIRSLRRRLVAVSMLLLVTSFSPSARRQSPPPTHARFEKIAALASAEYDQDRVGSLTVGVLDKTRVVWSKSYGLADPETNRVATAETVYRIGSITKQFTGLMLLQLVEQGKVRMSDPLTKYLPESSRIPALYPGMPSPTLVQVATMMGGFAREPSSLEKFIKGPVSGWEQTLLAAIPFATYAHEPGTKVLYSNIGYGMLGLALSRAAGQPYTEYVRDHILKPLGMEHTGFKLTERLRPFAARGFIIRDGTASSTQADQEEMAGRGYKVPNGGLYSTLGDLARFVAFEMGQGPSGVLKKETIDAYYGRTFSIDAASSSGYGLGLQAEFSGDLIILGHTGSTAGFAAAAKCHRHSGTGVVAFRTRSSDAMGGFATKILALAVGK